MVVPHARNPTSGLPVTASVATTVTWSCLALLGARARLCQPMGVCVKSRSQYHAHTSLILHCKRYDPIVYDFTTPTKRIIPYTISQTWMSRAFMLAFHRFDLKAVKVHLCHYSASVFDVATITAYLLFPGKETIVTKTIKLTLNTVAAFLILSLFELYLSQENLI